MVAVEHPDVDLDRLGAPQPLELALLQDAQQLHLRRQVDVADLVEEERAALGELEAALLPLLRAGERAPLVAEQLGFDQAVGQRRAAHLDERLVGARRVVVDGVRHHLLAGARLAADEDRRVGGGDLRHLLVHLAHRAAAADDAREVVALAQLLAQVQVLVDQPLLVLLDQPLHLDGLRDARRHDPVELDAAIVVAIGIELEVDGERPDGAPVEQDRHADERELFLRRARCRFDARFRNAGSLLTRGTTIGLPLSTTLPTMPSPRR